METNPISVRKILKKKLFSPLPNGSSVTGLKKAFKETVKDYLVICAETGKDPHKSYKGSFNIRIDPELHKKAAFTSLEMGISLNQFVEESISEYMAKKFKERRTK